jgi:aconitate hydratase
VYHIEGLDNHIQPLQPVTVRAERPDGGIITFTATARLNTMIEVNYYRNGGILHTVLRGML